MTDVAATSNGEREATQARVWRRLYEIQRHHAQMAYDAAKSTRFRREAKSGQLAAAVYETERDAEDLRKRSRWLYGNVTVFRSVVDSLVDLIVGPGLRPTITHPDPQVSGEARDLFEQWSETAADVRGMASLDELQRLAVREWIVAGESIAGLVRGPTIQMWESEQIIDTSQAPKDEAGEPRRMADGVEIDEVGRPVRYWLAPYRQTLPERRRTSGMVPAGKASGVGLTTDPDEFIRVEAKDALHVLHCDRLGAVRGLPMAAPVIEEVIDQAEFAEHTRIAAKAAAAISLLIKTLNPQRSLLNMGKQATGDDNATETGNFEIEPNSIWALQPGEDAEQVQSRHPAPSFEAFMKTMNRRIAAGMGLPAEVAFRDVADSNFSVAKLAENQAQVTAAPLRRQFVNRWCMPVWRRWIDRMTGEQGPLPGSSADYRVAWPDPARPIIDVISTLEGAELGFRLNVDSKEAFMARHGRSFLDVVEQRRREVELEQERGVGPQEFEAMAAGATERRDQRADRGVGRERPG